MNISLKIAISLPYLFSVRDFLFTPVWEEMAKRDEIHFFLLGDNTEVGKLITERNCLNITFVKFPPSSRKRKLLPRGDLLRDLSRRIWIRIFQLLDEGYIFDSLGYRFAAVNDLSHYKIRKGRSRKERKHHKVFLNYRKGEIVGYPFPKNTMIFRFLYKFHHGYPNIIRKEDLVFLKELNPDLFVFGRLHFMPTARWARTLRFLNIPAIGIVGSWDHPTVQGPTPRGMSGYMVASRRMVEEMSVLHGIQKEKIFQIGKPQMDVYMDRSIISSREDFLRDLGIPSDYRLVSFGTNTTGLKEHEVSIAKTLSDDFIAGNYGKATLLLRTHPQDVNWERDFLPLVKAPYVICMNANSFGNQTAENLSRGRDDIIFLANLMKHSDVVIQSRGSLALDAIAFDTPVISLAFDGDLIRTPNDSFLLENAYEHYKPLVTAQGTWMVGSYEALDHALKEYLKDPTIHSIGRRKIREEQMEPFDGKSSQRLIDYIVESAKKARSGVLPEGDWNYTGLGDVTWSSRQICDVREFIQK